MTTHDSQLDTNLRVEAAYIPRDEALAAQAALIEQAVETVRLHSCCLDGKPVLGIVTQELKALATASMQAALEKVKAETVEACCKIICGACQEGIPLADDKNHVGGQHCYAWAIRSIALRRAAEKPTGSGTQITKENEQ